MHGRTRVKNIKTTTKHAKGMYEIKHIRDINTRIHRLITSIFDCPATKDLKDVVQYSHEVSDHIATIRLKGSKEDFELCESIVRDGYLTEDEARIIFGLVTERR